MGFVESSRVERVVGVDARVRLVLRQCLQRALELGELGIQRQIRQEWGVFAREAPPGVGPTQHGRELGGIAHVLVVLDEGSAVEPAARHLRSPEPRLRKACAAQVGAVEPGFPQVGPLEVTALQICATQVRRVELDARERAPGQIGTFEVGQVASLPPCRVPRLDALVEQSQVGRVRHALGPVRIGSGWKVQHALRKHAEPRHFSRRVVSSPSRV